MHVQFTEITSECSQQNNQTAAVTPKSRSARKAPTRQQDEGGGFWWSWFCAWNGLVTSGVWASLSKGAQAVCVPLLTHCRRHDWIAWPSQGTLQRASGLGDTATKDAIKELIAREVFEIVQRGNGRTSTRYRYAGPIIDPRRGGRKSDPQSGGNPTPSGAEKRPAGGRNGDGQGVGNAPPNISIEQSHQQHHQQHHQPGDAGAETEALNARALITIGVKGINVARLARQPGVTPLAIFFCAHDCIIKKYDNPTGGVVRRLESGEVIGVPSPIPPKVIYDLTKRGWIGRICGHAVDASTQLRQNDSMGLEVDGHMIERGQLLPEAIEPA